MIGFQIELLFGLLFVGWSMSYVDRVFSVDLFKLAFGAVFVLMAILKVSVIG